MLLKCIWVLTCVVVTNTVPELHTDDIWKVPQQIILSNESSIHDIQKKTDEDMRFAPLKCSTSLLEETIKDLKLASIKRYYPLLKDIRKSYPSTEKFTTKSPFEENNGDNIFDTVPEGYCSEMAKLGTCIGRNDKHKYSYNQGKLWKPRDPTEEGYIDQIVYMAAHCRNTCQKMYKDVELDLMPDFIQKLGGYNRTIKENFNEPIDVFDMSQGFNDDARYRLLGVLAFNSLQPQIVPALHPVGFTKSKIPKKIYARILTARKKMKKGFEVESCDLGMQNCARILYSSQECHMVSAENYWYADLGKQTQSSVFEELRPLAEKWINNKIELLGTSVYGIRKYTRGAWLMSHLDHLKTHVVSAILNIAQDVKEDWPLQIFDHSGKMHEIILAPGDMVWYESAKLVHGRVKRLNGKYFENMFVHYMPRSLNWYDRDLSLGTEPKSVISLEDLEKYERDFRETRQNMITEMETNQKQQEEMYGQLSLEEKLSKLGNSDQSVFAEKL